ncbi:MAG: chemotaxis protein CheB [Planctomycetaceae bacterium]
MTNKKTERLPESPAPTDAASVARDKRSAPASFPIVGVGASAGGLEAFTQLLKALPLDTGMGFVLVQHLDPEHASALTQILSRATSLPVCDVTNNQPVQPNHVYIIPPDTNLSIAGGVLKLLPRPKSRTPHRPIDSFFESLAQDQHERAIGVVLTGTASDGTLGLEAIKAEGGITFAQDDSAKYDSMPRSAVAAGCVDLVLSPANIAKELARIAKHLGSGEWRVVSGEKEDSDGDSLTTHHSPLATLLSLLRNHSGVDFSLYKSSTIQRRITRRMVISKQSTLEDYAKFLDGNVKELDALCSDVLISVTSFFRNPEAFEALQREVLPKLLQQPGDDPIRVWVPGCSTGQEAYSIAIAFMESSEKSPRGRNLQVFATDLNDKLLEKARFGLYPKSLSDDISPERLRRFFVEEQGGYRVSKSLREMVVFARQNLFVDPPFSRMDLISCRNLLIYLGPSLQKKSIPTFHYALKPGGFLLLGASESVGGFTELFEPVDRKYKIYSKKAAPTPAFHSKSGEWRVASGEKKASGEGRVASGETVASFSPLTTRHSPLPMTAEREADRITVNQFAPPGVLVNADMQVLQFRGSTGAFLEPPMGKASFNLLKMAREGLMLPLRAAIEEAKKETKTTRRENIRVKHNGEDRAVSLEVIPLKNLPEPCFLILFEEENASANALASRRALAPGLSDDAAESGGLRPPARQEGEESNRIVELESDLSETREYLQVIQEQHEAASEELQAASEEVQSANEELQSINEELETSKEELESSNEELTTLNEEMTHRNSELSVLNNDLINSQNSTRLVLLLLGRDLTIRRFSPEAEKQFELRATDVGRPISHVRHNLVLAEDPKTPLDLEEVCVEVITTVREKECEVLDKAGRWHSLRVRPYTTLDKQVDGTVLLLLEIDAIKQSEQAVAAARDYAENIVETVRDPLLVLDSDLRIVSANLAFYRVFRVEPAETIGTFIYDLGNRQWDIPRLRELLEEILPQSKTVEDFEVEHNFEQLGQRTMLLNARTILNPLQKTDRILLAIEDITERKQLEAKLHASETLYRRLFETAKDGVLILDANNGRILEANPYMTELSGIPTVEFIGQELWEIGLFRDQPANEAAFRELQQNGYVRYDHLPLKSKNGQPVEVEFVSNIYQWDHRRVAQCNIRDITVRSRLEKQTKNQAAELSDLHRRKDEFLAMLSHELRSPLAPIANAVELLGLQRGSETLIQQQARGIIQRQMGHLQHLVDDLLEVSRITTGRVQLRKVPVTVSTIVEGAVETARPLIEQRRHELTVSLPTEPIWLQADTARMEQVLVNLLTNAAKYTEEGGHVSLSVELDDPAVATFARTWESDEEPHVLDSQSKTTEPCNPKRQRGSETPRNPSSNSLADASGYIFQPALANVATKHVIIRIRDTGVGISPELLPHVFDLFTQAERSLDRSQGGLGIGLALVQRLTELHGGTVEAHSTPGQGSEFVVRLPVLSDEAQLSGEALAAGSSLATHSSPLAPVLKVLVVDDNVDTVLSFSMLLKASGHEVRTAHDGPTAVQVALDYQPDAVLLDIGLPGLNGYQVAQRIRQDPNLKNVVLVALTGYGQEADRQTALDAGFNHHLVKPARLEQLQKILATVSERVT